MKRRCCEDQKVGSLLLTILIWILAFQSPLESIWSAFSYIDEGVALIGALWGLYDIVILRKGRPTKEQLWIGIPLAVFITVGLAGNLIYRYQPLKCVVIDLFTNLKFFFAIGTGYYLFSGMDRETQGKCARQNAKAITLALFLLFLADRVFSIWPGEVRFGIASAQLFYSHPTYLAGAAAFLIILLTVFYEKKNLPFIAMALVLMAFTMRAKSLASAAAYAAVFVFFLVWKLKLKLWYVAVLGAACVVIAWPQISFYFIDLGGTSARSVMLVTSFLIMKDYFPIGTGFGTYGSAEAAKIYSPVYLKYKFNENFELRDINDLENTMQLIAARPWTQKMYEEDPGYAMSPPFLSDQFWPIICGQTGVIGTAIFLLILFLLVKKCLSLDKYDLYAYVGVLFAFIYLLISSVAEPAFHNSMAVPLALVIGMVFQMADRSFDAQ